MRSAAGSAGSAAGRRARETLAAGLPHSVNAGVEDVGAAAVGFLGDRAVRPLRRGRRRRWPAACCAGATAGSSRSPTCWPSRPRLNPDRAGRRVEPVRLLAGRRPLPGRRRGRQRRPARRRGRLGGPRRGLRATTRSRPGWRAAPTARSTSRCSARWPHDPGGGRVERIGADGGRRTAVGGLTMPIGVAFDRAGVMHVLEFAAGLDLQPRLRFRPDSGRLLRVVGGRAEPVFDGLHYPTALALGPTARCCWPTVARCRRRGSGSCCRYQPCTGRYRTD